MIKGTIGSQQNGSRSCAPENRSESDLPNEHDHMGEIRAIRSLKEIAEYVFFVTQLALSNPRTTNCSLNQAAISIRHQLAD